jgi:hypothetical protein
MRTTFFAPVLLLLLAGCHEDCNDCGGPSLPLFQEAEPNDDPLTANDFGIVQVGDHFLIQGFVRDDVADPFDGFAFTAATALHVDFQLFMDTGTTDLDVCLYDPLLDQTVACFATQSDPEQGGVDVSAGGLDFHLVVESFVGDGPYTLEIDVQPLFLGATASELSAAPQPGIAGVNARAERTTAAETGYLREKPAARPLVQVEQILQVDRASGTVLAITHVRRNGDS